MRKTSAKVFEDYIQVAALPAQDFYTPLAFNSYLATDDQLAAQLVIDRVTLGGGSGTIALYFETSGNQIDWVSKSGSTLCQTSVSNGTVTSLNGFDAGTLPTLGHGRIRISFAGLTVLPAIAHVRVFVTMRDAAQVIDPFSHNYYSGLWHATSPLLPPHSDAKP